MIFPKIALSIVQKTTRIALLKVQFLLFYIILHIGNNLRNSNSTISFHTKPSFKKSTPFNHLNLRNNSWLFNLNYYISKNQPKVKGWFLHILLFRLKNQDSVLWVNGLNPTDFLKDTFNTCFRNGRTSDCLDMKLLQWRSAMKIKKRQVGTSARKFIITIS